MTEDETETLPTILVVDDDPAIRHLLQTALRMSGFTVETAEDGRTALAITATTAIDLVVLDVMLPDMDGFAIARGLRADGDDVPVLFLTARGAQHDRVEGLEAGGDDFVVKPFSLEEVVLRIRAILRRTRRQPDSVERLIYHDLELDLEAHRAWRAGHEIWLSATEFRLLEYLMVNAENVLSKTQILERVWGHGADQDERVVHTFISQLRRKIDAHGEPVIHTLRGVGYTLRVNPVRA